MAEQVKAEAGVLDTAAATADDHRVNQNTIAAWTKSVADECQAGWVGQGTAAVAQATVQSTEKHHRIGRALLKLSDGLRSIGTALTSADSEVAIGARCLDSGVANNYRNLP